MRSEALVALLTSLAASMPAVDARGEMVSVALTNSLWQSIVSVHSTTQGINAGGAFATGRAIASTVFDASVGLDAATQSGVRTGSARLPASLADATILTASGIVPTTYHAPNLELVNAGGVGAGINVASIYQNDAKGAPMVPSLQFGRSAGPGTSTSALTAASSALPNAGAGLIALADGSSNGEFVNGCLFVQAGQSNFISSLPSGAFPPPGGVIPEPRSWALLLGGLIGLASMRRRTIHLEGTNTARSICVTDSLNCGRFCLTLLTAAGMRLLQAS